MSNDTPDIASRRASAEVVAWKRFCQRIEAMGETILSDEFPHEEADRAEGIAHLAEQVSCWLGWSIGHSDTTAPFFHRSNDLVTQWGGPNQDNAYHHTRIDPKRRYRVRGKMHDCDSFAITFRVGFMHMKEWGTQASISSFDRGIGPGDDFEILVGGDGSDPDFFPIPESVTTLSLREYYLDWKPTEPAIITIECLDDIDAPERLTADRVAGQIDHALEQVERSMIVWNDYMKEHRAKGVDNEFAPQMTVAKGLSDARYAFLFWDLAPSEAIYIETDVPDARYWGLQLASMGWFEQVDPVHRITAINQAQANVGSDGRVRFALAHSDPGVPNWLDTQGRRNGLLTFRWFWPKSDPTPTTEVVPFSDLRGRFPDDTPKIDSAARREQVRARKEHLAWRFRS